MPNPWVPFDADADEVAELHIVRDDIPESARSAILAWVWDRLSAAGHRHGFTSSETIHFLQTSLRVNLGYPLKEAPSVNDVLQRIEEHGGNKLLLRMIDLLASAYSPDPWGDTPSDIETLMYHLDTSSAAIEVYATEDGDYRLRRRIPEGVEEVVQAAIDLDSQAGRHLAEAWRAATAMEANTSHAMAEAIRAVDLVSGAVVLPKDKKPTMFKVVKAIRDQGDWGLVLRDSDGYPDHQEVLIGMMETLAKAQTDRHGGSKASPLEAQAHVQLAATLVHWFASGAVIRLTRP